MLKVQDLYVHYEGAYALRGVSIEVNEGDIVVLVGANGAGKTTLLRTIAGAVKPEKGKITFLDRELTGGEPHEAVKLGMTLVPEGRQVFPNLTVRENLEIGGYLVQRKRASANMERVYSLFPRLKERESQLAGTLSGGEQQMLAIGRGLMSEPRLLMLDEPSLGLAPLLVEQLFEVIKEIRNQGTSILLVEQNAAKALALASYGYVLYTGRIVLGGTHEEIMKNKEFVKAYMGGLGKTS